MTFEIPLGSFPGRGIDLPLNLKYNSKVWRIGFLRSRYWTPNGKNSVAEAIYSEFATAGWTTSLDVPVVEWPKVQDLYWYTGKPYANGSVYPYTFRVARVYIHMPDGSTHELRKADGVQQDTGSVDTNGTFYAVDNSRMRYDASGATAGVLYLPDGSRYNISSTTVQFIDRNGNTLTYNVSSRQWTDTMGRTIGMPWPTNPQAGVEYQYSVPGFKGNAVTYTLKFAQLSSALSPNSPSLMPVGDWYLPNPSLPPGDYNTANNPQPQSPSMFHSAYTDPEELDYRTYTQVIGRGQPGNTNFNPVVLAEVVSPNNLSYKFSYNNYGEIDKIIYPSGAYQRYEYGWVAALGYPVIPYGASRGLTNRWLSANGTGTDEVQWNYSFEGPFVLVMTAPGPTGAANGIQTKTYLYNEPNPQNNFGYDDALNGMAYEERIYAPASEGGALLRRTLTKWDKSSGTYNRPSPGTGTYTPTRNPRPIKTVTIWLDTGGDALTTTSTFNYDTTYWWNVGLDRIGSSEYGFTLVDQNTAQNGTIDSVPLGPLVRTTSTSYTTSDLNYRSRNILGLPTYSSISDAGGVVSQTFIDYDESSYPLIPVGPVVGWNDPQTTLRGNPTTVRKWLNYPAVTWIQTHTQYDGYGNVRKTWDGMDRALPSAEIDYSSSYYYAYPTTTSTIAPDPNGTYGQPMSLTKTTLFDVNTGLVLSTTDANGQTTSFEYNDPLYRQTKVTRPDGGWTSTLYNDDPASTYVRTQTLQRTTPSQQVIESYQYFDKLGRNVRTFVNEGATYLTADTQYDLLGRPWRASNPYRTTGPSLNTGVNPSNQWTTNSYDSQNRVTSITTADGAHVNSSYGYNLLAGYLGTTVTVSDQTGKARKSLTDGIGRVVQVVEDPGSLALQTNYAYDAMNNLRKVEQGNQLRYFGYDSLSRVIFVRQVEQTVNAALPAWTDPVTGYAGGWTAAFTYDNNGNTLTRTEARNITATYTYDQLNRVTTLRYTNDPQNTPGVDTYYDGYRANNYTPINNVKGQAWQTETINQVRFTVDNFDVMGRPTIQRQQFWWNNTWSNPYEVRVGYDFAGAITGQTYPSGHTTTYSYDQAGRLQTFSGTLGDNSSRTYANNFQYNDYGLLQQEQFGTQIPLYHKQRFNSRGQLWEMRLSTVSFDSDPANGDRGSIVNYFSGSYMQGGSGTDNNGNLLRQEMYVPGGPYFQQTYGYDNLNRLTSASEKLNGTGTDSFKQIYTYDRWGNRSVDASLSSANVPRPAYTVDTSTNRLVAPAGFTYGYDNAGNQTNDTYTGGGQRTFDAENHMLSAQEATGSQSYRYSGSGLRVRRVVNGAEVWQVYDFGGALLAEYPANGAVANPQTEYGYRNGQLLITADGRTNVALAANGGVASASSAHTCCGFSVSGAINGNIQGPWGNGEGWNDATPNEVPDWFQVDFAGSKTIVEIDVFSLHDNYTEQNTPTEAQTFSLYGLINFDVQYWNGSAWTTISGGSVTGNNKVWRKFTFAPITTSKIRLWITGVPDSWSRLVELQAWEAGSGVANLALNKPATQSSTGWDGLAQRGVDGNTDGNFWNGSVTHTAFETQPWWQVDLQSVMTLQNINVWNRTDCCGEALTNFYVFVSDNPFTANDVTSTQNQPGVSTYYVAGQGGVPSMIALNRTGRYVRVQLGGYERLSVAEVQVFGSGGSKVQWLVSDQLGTPRLAVDQSGTLSSVKRHDYLPFGEEIGSSQVGLIGGRTDRSGYVADNVRQKFTGYEFDAETGLNYAQARYQSSAQGRFTSVDPLGASANIGDPQSFNRYSYVQNMPLTAVDPTGMALSDIGVYQTSNPEVAELLYKKTLLQPQQHRRNPELPKPRPVKIDQKNLPPPPGGPVSTTIPIIDVGPAPLPAGEEPWPTTIDVTQSDNKTYNGEPVTSPSGDVIDPQPNYGVGRTVDYTIGDQAGNPMSSRVLVQETVAPINKQAEAMMQNVDVNRQPQKPNSNGIVPDTLGPISRNPNIIDLLNRNQLNAEFSQTITVFGVFGQEYRTALTLTNTLRFTNTGATLTLGAVQQHPRPQ
jgi:RHS repeat-associated protein